jgi:hypothetical protein
MGRRVTIEYDWVGRDRLRFQREYEAHRSRIGHQVPNEAGRMHQHCRAFPKGLAANLVPNDQLPNSHP